MEPITAIAVTIIGLVFAIAWTILPFVVFRRLRRIERVLESCDLHLSYMHREAVKDSAK